MRPLRELILPLIHLSLLELRTICCDDRHYLPTVYLFTQRDLLFRLPGDLPVLSRLPGQLSFNLNKGTKKKGAQIKHILLCHRVITMRTVRERYRTISTGLK